MTVPAPTITSLSPDTGALTGHPNLTDVSVLTLSGTATANTTVQVFDGTTLLGTAAVDASGVWSFTTGQLASGTHSFTATAIDGAGIPSAPSTAVSMTIDTHVPDVPVILTAAAGTDNAVTLTGTAEANDVVTIYDGTNLLGATVANAAGNWSFTTAPLDTGVHHFTATATDAAGTTSAPSPDPVVVTPPVILTASQQNIAVDKESSTSYSDTITLVGTAVASSTITVYDGATQLGTTTANSSGVWTYATSALADGAHSFTATATSSGSTSTASSAVVETVAGSIANFSPLTDQWSAPISVGGMPYFVENANTNGNAPWAITEVNDHTLQFQLQPADLWPDNASHRSEISGGTVLAPTATVNLSYQFEVQPGFNDTSGQIAWQILGQFHADDNNPIYQSLSGGNPILSFHLTGPSGLGEGDYLAVSAFYALTGQTSFTEATLPGNPLNGYLYVSPTPVLRGQYNDVQVEASFQNNSSGFLEVWVNGAEVVNYHGPIGYGGGVYWKEGVYEGWSSNQTITVDYANTVLTTAPGAPLILGSVVNGNEVMLNGTAEANSTVAVYDGATKLGTVTATGKGAWFYETGTLSTGTHSLTATATDTAGNVSSASSASSASITSFTGPIITQVATSAAAGESLVGNTITFTLTMSSAVTVTGTPTLTLNDGGTAAYKSGSGTNALTFSYTVGAGDSTVTGLSIAGANLPGGATITDGSGNAAILTGAAVQFPGVVVDTQAVQTPVFGSPVANSNGTFTFHGTAGANTTVYMTTPYTGGLGSAVVNSAGQWTLTTPTLAYNAWNNLQAYDVNSLGDVSAIGTESGGGFGDSVNLPSSPTITGNALTGNAVTLYGMVTSGLSITNVTVFDGSTQLGTATINSDNSWSFTTSALTTGVHAFSAKATNASGTSGASAPDAIIVGSAPTISAIVESPSSGDLNAGNTVTLTLDMSKVVTVDTTGGTPTLTLNDGTTATYTGGSGTNALVFSYTVAAGQNTAALAATAVNLNGATIADGSGNAASFSLTGLPQTGPQIDTSTPSVSSVAASGTGITAGAGDRPAGSVVTLTLNLNEAVTVADGVPTLTLNDGGTASYTGGSGTNALTFSYTVGAGQNAAALAVTAVNLNSATVMDGAGNAANLAGTVTTLAGLQIDTMTPSVSSVAASGTGITAGAGDLNAGHVVTLTVNLSEAVTVAGGVPTLTLNDGGTASYTGGSGTNALTFSYTVGAGQNTAALAVTAVNLGTATVKDGAGNAANLAGAVTTLSGPQIDTTTPTVSSVAASGTGITAGAGDLAAGSVVTLTLNLNEAVTVAGGVPTLTLNDGGTASYMGGSGTNALTFSYTVGAGQNAAALAVTAVNLGTATVKDGAGNAANLAGAVTTLAGLQIDATTPSVSSVAASGTGITAGAGDLAAGSVVTLTLNLNEAVTVAGGVPTLTLNDGGTASYTGGSGTNALTFSYTVGAGQNAAALAVTAVNLNSATVVDGAGNAANLAGAVTTLAGLQIDTTTPSVSSVAASGTGITAGAGDLNAGHVVTLTLNLNEAVTVAGGVPTLTLNDGGTASYMGGSGTNALTFSYTVGAGQNAAALAVTTVNLGTATVKDGAGNAANLAGAVTTLSGLQIDTTTPSVSSVAATGTGITAGTGDLAAGSVVTLTLNLNEAVTVAGGIPTLMLNDGGTASYMGGSGTNALTFSYTVAAGQNTADLAVTSVNLGTATVKDGAGNAANLTGAVTNPAGILQIDTTGPTVSSVATSGTGITAGAGDLTTGSVVTLTVNLSSAVTVAGGTPTLTLNDGGTATYMGGSGSNALTFSYTVAAGQNTADLAVTAVNLGTATVKDGAGNAANLAGAVSNPAGTLQIDTTTPTAASVVTSGTGITAGAGDLAAGSVVTLTINMSEAVTVAGGTPTLTLNDGGTASYMGGSGTNALTFSYTVGAGQNTADLTVTAFNPGTATVKNGAGTAANLTGAATNPAGTLQIDTTAPTVSSIAESPSSGDLNAGKVVVVTLTMSENVTVNTTGGTPTLTLNDGGTATYTGGSGSSALTFSYTVGAGQNTPDLMETAVNLNGATVQDGAGNAANLSLIGLPQGSPQIDTTAPTVSSVVTSGTGITAGAGDLTAGSVVTLTLNMSEAVNVTGTPTLTLNDGGTATYTGGTGTNALSFNYTVAAGQNTSDLTVTAVTGTVADLAGNAANLTGAVTNPAGTLQIDTTTPVVSTVSATAGDYDAGNTLTLTLNMSAAVNVTGTPTLTLNDGGTATYTGGTGTSALTFSYTVAAGQNTTGLAVTGVTGTIADSAGNALSTSNLPETFTGVTIDTTAPTVSSVVTSGTGITAGAGDLAAGGVVTLTLNMSEAVNVTGIPTLTFNDGGTATYASGTGSNALTFHYTVAAGQNTPDLTVTAVTGTIADLAGNAANLTGAVTNPAGTLQIDTTTPTLSSVTETPSNGHLKAGKSVTLTLNLSEAVTVAGGTPTLALSSGGTASYTGGSGTNALTFSYTVAAGQNTASLAATAVNLNGATIKDGAGNVASLSLTSLTQTGAQIDTTIPAVTQVVASPATGIENPGMPITLTLDLSKAVTVTGTPTLTLNDGGTATYTSGSGTNALTFSYTVGPSDSAVSALAITQVNLPNGTTISDVAGNAADLSGALTTLIGLQIDPPALSLGVVTSSLSVAHGQSLPAWTLFAAEMPTGDTITKYAFWDTGAGGGHFLVNGVAQGNNQEIDVTAAQLAQVTYQSGSGADTLWVRANDGTVWSPWSSSFTVTAPIDTGPLETVSNVTASHGQSFAGSSLFTYSDPFGSPATQYDFWNTGSGGAHFVLNGVTLGANQENIITAAQLAQLSYQSGSGADTLWVRANDGTLWGAWSSAITVTAPVDTGSVEAVANLTATHGQSFGGSSLFTYSDPFGSPATQYDFWNTGSGGGHFVLNGVTLGANQENIITAAQLAQLSYQSGSGADTLWVRANDGTLWGAWSSAITVTAPVDTGSVEAVANLTATHGQSFGGSSLFTYSDPFGSAATQYDFWNTGSGGGHFVLNGVTLGANRENIITAAQLAQLSYQSGSGADTLWVRANDGTVWGAWSSAITVTAPVDTGSVEAVANLTATHGQSFGGSSLFTYSDPFGSAATQYDFWNTGSGGGHFVLNGVTLGANQENIITAAQLAQLSYQSGSGADTLWVRANDGTVWGAWSSAITVTAPVDTGSVEAVANLTATHGQSFGGSSLFTYSDPFGSAATQYDFWNTGSGGGHFVLNGVTLGANQENIITAAQLAQLSYQSGSGADTLWVRANDGTVWGAWSSAITVTAPVDTGSVEAVANLTATHGQSFGGSSLFTYSDPFGSAATQYDFWDTGTGGGHFVLNGVTLGANQDNYVTAAQLAQLSYQSGSGADTLWVRANDGTVWGPWSNSFTVAAPIDTGPAVASVSNVVTVAGQSFAASSLFTASDPFGDAMTQYDFWDTGSGGGHFVLNGVTLGANQNNILTAAQEAQLTYVSGTGTDTLWVQVSEGGQWSPWSQSFTVSDPSTIGVGATLELASAYSGTLSFAGATGALKIDHSSSFSGTIGRQLAIGDVIDLADITAGANATIGYTGNNSPGTLTVSDGTHTASIALLGNYSLANFTASSDGHGGTSVVDPPLAGGSPLYTSKDPAASQAGINQQMALLSQSMASFDPSDGGGIGTSGPLHAYELGQPLNLTQPVATQQHA